MLVVNKIVVLLLFMVVFVAGCSSPQTKRADLDSDRVAEESRRQKELAFEARVEYLTRLHNLSFPLLLSAKEFCNENVVPASGIGLVNISMLGEAFSEVADKYNITDTLQVNIVSPGSPAEKAGILKGDEISSINGIDIPKGEKALIKYTEVYAAEAEGNNQLTFTMLRDGKVIDINLIPETSCKYGMILVGSPAVNAFADGDNVYMTKGMMRFAKDDVELSLVISHEIAHNAMGHIEAKKTNFWLGSILDIAAAVYGVDTQRMFGRLASQAYSQEFEAEADYVGLYILARDNQKIEHAPLFWRRMAAEFPGNIKNNHAATHPATSERFVALEQTVTEIKNKQDSGIPLNPEMKVKNSALGTK